MGMEFDNGEDHGIDGEFDATNAVDDEVEWLSRTRSGVMFAVPLVDDRDHVRDSLPDDVARTVASSIVGSRLDYGNPLLAGASKSNLVKLQQVQNTLVRIVLH